MDTTQLKINKSAFVQSFLQAVYDGNGAFIESQILASAQLGERNKKQLLRKALSIVVENGHLGCIKILYPASKDAELADELLSSAFKRGYFDIVDYFVQECAGAKQFGDIIKTAARNGYLGVIKSILDAKNQRFLNAEDEDRLVQSIADATECAVQMSHFLVLKCLIPECDKATVSKLVQTVARTANIDALNCFLAFGIGDLDREVLLSRPTDNYYFQIVQALYDSGMSQSEIDFAFRSAAACNQVEVVKLLKNKLLLPNNHIEFGSKNNKKGALYRGAVWAAENGHLDIVIELFSPLKVKRELPYEQFDIATKQVTLIIPPEALSGFNEEQVDYWFIVEYLKFIAKEAIMRAAKNGHRTIIDFFLKAEVLQLKYNGGDCKQAFRAAALAGYFEVAELILNSTGESKCDEDLLIEISKIPRNYAFFDRMLREFEEIFLLCERINFFGAVEQGPITLVSLEALAKAEKRAKLRFFETLKNEWQNRYNEFFEAERKWPMKLNSLAAFSFAYGSNEFLVAERKRPSTWNQLESLSMVKERAKLRFFLTLKSRWRKQFTEENFLSDLVRSGNDRGIEMIAKTLISPGKYKEVLILAISLKNPAILKKLVKMKKDDEARDKWTGIMGEERSEAIDEARDEAILYAIRNRAQVDILEILVWPYMSKSVRTLFLANIDEARLWAGWETNFRQKDFIKALCNSQNINQQKLLLKAFLQGAQPWNLDQELGWVILRAARKGGFQAIEFLLLELKKSSKDSQDFVDDAFKEVMEHLALTNDLQWSYYLTLCACFVEVGISSEGVEQAWQCLAGASPDRIEDIVNVGLDPLLAKYPTDNRNMLFIQSITSEEWNNYRRRKISLSSSFKEGDNYHRKRTVGPSFVELSSEEGFLDFFKKPKIYVDTLEELFEGCSVYQLYPNHTSLMWTIILGRKDYAQLLCGMNFGREFVSRYDRDGSTALGYAALMDNSENSGEIIEKGHTYEFDAVKKIDTEALIRAAKIAAHSGNNILCAILLLRARNERLIQ